MKNIFLFLASMFLIANVNGQDVKKLLKTASKDFAKYNQNQADNKDKLASSIEAIEQAFALEGTENDASAWVIKGEIYNGITDNEMRQKLINPNYTLGYTDAAIIACEAFQMALDKAEKKSETKDAIKGLQEVENHLNNMAITKFQAGEYDNAYANFLSSLTAYELLEANREKSRLDDEVTMNDQVFYTAISGYYGVNKDKVASLFKKLYEKEYNEPLVYEALYNLSSKSNPDEALRYLTEGREKFPDNTTLLFGEINYYLTQGKLDVLIDKLKSAIDAEPENLSVINTTGNVYEQLATKAAEDGDTEQAGKYFDKAKEYYNLALEKNPTNFDANYSIGALYYNEAAGMTELINKYAQDYSPAGTKKYDEANAQMMALFEQALPYFEKAYKIKEDDTNTMIALKEIYVRQNKMDKANELKAKLGQ